jgi:serine/threonine protein kinase
LFKDPQGNKKVNQYKILNELGRGQFSKVVKCLNEETKLCYAMKIINRKKLKRIFLNGPNISKTIETELAILKKLVWGIIFMLRIIRILWD